jgi:cytochrome c-type biogenesis protein CcsB
MLMGAAYALLWIAALAYAWYARRDILWTGRAATGITIVSWGLLTISLGQRALAAGHWPLTNRYEFALCFVWAILGLYLLLETSWRERQAGGFVLAVALLVATYAVLRPADERAIAPLLPALRSGWLQIHVLTTLVGYAAFGVAAGLGLMQLIRWKMLENESILSRPEAVLKGATQHPEKSSAPFDTRPASLGATQAASPKILAREEIERTMNRVVALGFPWLTLGILTGAIWAQNAWGRYWGWDPKETWALVTWLWYLLILHVRPLRSWRGQRLAGLVVVGFGIVIFTFIGVPWLVRTVRLESLHGF